MRIQRFQVIEAVFKRTSQNKDDEMQIFSTIWKKKGPSQKTQREAGYTPKEIALLSGFILQIDFYPPFFWHSVQCEDLRSNHS